MSLTFGSLFAGIGGIDLGLERAGMTCKWQVEINDFCNKVLEKHWPEVKRYRDVREVGIANLEPVDLIAGGFPCQDVSLAGKRAGLHGKRSTLWSEFYRIICEIQPSWVLIENVTGLFSSDNGKFFRKILWELSSIGFDVEWETVPAAWVGAPHIRHRVFIIANTDSSIRTDGLLQARRDQIETQRKKGFWGFDWSEFEVESRPTAILQRWSNNVCESPLMRVDDGLPEIVDRLKSLGNAVVPQVAEFIGRCILEAENEQN